MKSSKNTIFGDILLKLFDMERAITSIVILLSLYITSFGQTRYLPQKTDYDIKAYFDDKTKTIEAEGELTYKNNSDKSLNEIFIHLHANAYKNKQTQFADKLIENKITDFNFSKESERGGYQSITFTQNDGVLNWKFVDKDEEIVKIELKNTLQKGESLKLRAKFKLKIPKAVNGFGHTDNQINFINWFPKFAVLDKTGWNTMNANINGYLYSDFGDYNIEINFPKEYTIVSSGKLQDTENLNYKNLKYKKWKFSASKITDFGFVAGKDLLKSTYKIQFNNRVVDLNLYYSPEIRKLDTLSVLNVAKNMLLCMSARLTDYPYPALSIVVPKEEDFNFTTSCLINQGLKKYRKRTIAEFNDNLIDKIASLWIEGVVFNANALKNSDFVYGLKYFYANSCKPTIINIDDEDSHFWETINSLNRMHHFNSMATSKSSYSQCPQNCDVFWSVIGKSSLAFNYLEDYWGRDVFDENMRIFATVMRFSHPTKNDFESFLTTVSDKPMDWFYEGMINDNKPLQYDIENVKKTSDKLKITIKNNGKHKIPFKLGSIVEGQKPKTTVIEGFLGKKKIELEEPFASRLKIDPYDKYFRDIDLKTKYKVANKFKSNKSLRFKKDHSKNRMIFPSMGFNRNDGFMLGAGFAFSNYTNELDLIPMYGFRSKSLVGIGYYKKRLSVPGFAKILNIGIDARSFYRHYNKEKDFNLRYYRVSPFLIADLREKPYFGKEHFLTYSFSYIGDESFNGTGIDQNNRYVNKVNYIREGGNVLLPYRLNIGLQHQYHNIVEASQNLSVSAELKTGVMYKNKRYINMRLYGAAYIFNKNPYSFFSNLYLIGYNQSDYNYEHYYFDRSAQSGFWSNQIHITGGGFKTAVSNSELIGKSRKYIVAANFRMDLPVKFFIKPYFDIGMYGYRATLSDKLENKFLYSGGLVFEIVKDYVEFYLPVINSEEIENYYKSQDSYFNRISFMLNLDFLGKDRDIIKDPF